MNRFCAVLGAALTFGATPASYSEQLPSPLIVTQVAPGVFVHIGDTALMSRDNEGAIANVIGTIIPTTMRSGATILRASTERLGRCA